MFEHLEIVEPVDARLVNEHLNIDVSGRGCDNTCRLTIGCVNTNIVTRVESAGAVCIFGSTNDVATGRYIWNSVSPIGICGNPNAVGAFFIGREAGYDTRPAWIIVG